MAKRFTVKNGIIYDGGVEISIDGLKNFIDRQEATIAKNSKTSPELKFASDIANNAILPDLTHAKDIYHKISGQPTKKDLDTMMED